MNSEQIVKTFHYCRQDSVALHHILGTCVRNVFDTSAVDCFRNQLGVYKESDYIFQKNKIISKFNNLKISGLNQVLKKYEAPNGINKFKDKFHTMFREGDDSITAKRPLNPEYKEYCVMDVMDLPHVRRRMSEGLNPSFVRWLGTLYSRQND